jgi:hypothetical protein
MLRPRLSNEHDFTRVYGTPETFKYSVELNQLYDPSFPPMLFIYKRTPAHEKMNLQNKPVSKTLDTHPITKLRHWSHSDPDTTVKEM